MVDSWVAFTVLAALMQAVRTAGQKQLSNSLSPMTATTARYLYGLPFVILYLLFLYRGEAPEVLRDAVGNSRFLFYAVLASIAQIIATVLLIKVFSFRNFAVGTSFAKTEAIQTAVFAMVFFGATLSGQAWLAILIGFIGIAVVSVPIGGARWEPTNIVIGTLSGTAFSFTSLWLREASLSLSGSAQESAAVTLCVMVTIQTCMCCIYSVVKEAGELGLLRRQWRMATFVGITSALGSVGWFTAMTLMNPALVKSLGQIEFIFTLLITTVLFKEKITLREFIGMALIVASVILILS